MTGLVTAIYDIGCALGAVVAFVYGEKIGRKRSIILANLIVVVGAAIQTASFEYWLANPLFRIKEKRTDISYFSIGKCSSLASLAVSVSGSRRLQCQFCSRKHYLRTTVVRYWLSSLLSLSLVLRLLLGYVSRHCMPIARCNGASLLLARFCSRSWSWRSVRSYARHRDGWHLVVKSRRQVQSICTKVLLLTL